jgi:hypothetical protein
MGLDLNKIINESVSEMKDQTTDTDNTDIETLTEGTDVNTDIDTQTTNVDAEANVNSACLASAISAGLGAMTFRNKLSRLNEGLSEKAKQRLKTGAKIGAGLAAAGAAGAGLYNKFKGNDDDGDNDSQRNPVIAARGQSDAEADNNAHPSADVARRTASKNSGSIQNDKSFLGTVKQTAKKFINRPLPAGTKQQ